jgi:hypothetical protein
MKTNIIDKAKDWHIRICIAVLLLPSIFMFFAGLRFEDSIQNIPWWYALAYGWSGLAVALKLSEIWYKE